VAEPRRGELAICSNVVGQAPGGALGWIKRDRAASLCAYRRRPDISRHYPPSATGERQKIPRNLTKLGHRTGRSGPSQRYLG